MADGTSSFEDLYPFEPRYLDLDGVRMHYVDEGSGPAVLMLHGNPTWSFYYRELIKGLRDRFRVIVPDHVGCGLSDKPQRYEYTLETHIRNLSRLVDHLDVGALDLVVHDWGGAIGFGWAMRNSEQVRRIVVFNTSAFAGPCPWRIRICRWPGVGALLVRGFNAFAGAAVQMACKNRARMTPEIKRGYLLPYVDWASRIATLRFVQDIPLESNHPTRALLAEVEASLPQFADRPMLICWGGRDFCFNDWFLSQWRSRFPRAEVHEFPEAGHYVVEDAVDGILPLVSQFLA